MQRNTELAQLVEHWSPKPGVGSSSLSSRAKEINEMKLFNKISTYTQEVYNELVNKVSWPTRSQLVSSSVIVMVASIILSLVIFAVDQVIDLAMHGIYSI